MPTIRYHGHSSEGIELPDGTHVAHGGRVEVDDEIAGRPPKGKPGEKGYDPGEGLLAQADEWAPVSTKED